MSEKPGEDYDVTDSDQTVEGDIGVSSGRVGPTGPGQEAPTGVKDTSVTPSPPDDEAPPEQAPGGEEFNPEGLEPKAGYSKVDPRSAE